MDNLDDTLSKTDTDLLLSIFEAHKVFWEALNLKRFGEPGRRVFTEDLSDSDVLGAFHMQGYIYHTVWPDNCPQNIKHAGSRYVQQDLKVFVVMPEILRTCLRKVRIMVDFHGGGGFTGHPLFGPWRQRAWIEYLLLAGDMVSIEPTYCLMPESSGPEILENLAELWLWLVKKLESTLQDINPNLTVDWDHFSISGLSFGGLMAMGLYREIARQSLKPAGLRVRGMLLRCPVSRHYHREAGHYLGIAVPKEEAELVAKAIITAKQKLPWIIKRAGSSPPGFMIGAYAFSVSNENTWSFKWGAPSMYNLLEEMEVIPDKRTRILILHGTKDQHVQLQDSLKLAEMLRIKTLDARCCPVNDAPHVWDYEDPLNADIKGYWDDC